MNKLFIILILVLTAIQISFSQPPPQTTPAGYTLLTGFSGDLVVGTVSNPLTYEFDLSPSNNNVWQIGYIYSNGINIVSLDFKYFTYDPLVDVVVNTLGETKNSLGVEVENNGGFLLYCRETVSQDPVYMKGFLVSVGDIETTDVVDWGGHTLCTGFYNEASNGWLNTEDINGDNVNSSSVFTMTGIDIVGNSSEASGYQVGNNFESTNKDLYASFSFYFNQSTVANGTGHVSFGLDKDFAVTEMMVPDVVLPIELLSFDVRELNEDVLISWQTGSEENFSHFALERSDDFNTEWKAIQIIDTQGEQSEYQHIDIEPYDGVNYYRLKMVDTDSSVEYSDIKAIKVNKDKSYNQIFMYRIDLGGSYIDAFKRLK